MVIRLAVVVACLLVACSGKTKGVEDARKHAPAHDSSAPADPTAPPPSGNGDVQLRVEWKDVPLASRASPGRTACGTPRAPSVAPTTTWGIPDVFVMLEVPRGSGGGSGSGSGSGAPTKPAHAAEGRVVLDRCALVPRVTLATDKLVLTSAADAPAKLALLEAKQLPFDSAAAPGTPHTVYLPVAGHSVAAPLDARGVYSVQIENADGVDLESAWVVAADSQYVAITEASGQVVMRDVPVGTYTATAWLPPRGGQDAKIAHARVTVTDGGLADVTLDISK